MLRGRLTITGPTTAPDLARSIGLQKSVVEAALLSLEADGVVLRGKFCPAANSQQPEALRGRAPSDRGSDTADPASRPSTSSGRPELVEAPTRDHPGTDSCIEWCDRSLLARIHRYTLNRLRAEIEPVSPADFMRFLFAWQHVGAPGLLTSIEGLREIISMLDGFELSASAWERAVLPARMDRYEPQFLDMLCLAGEVGWARVSAAPSDPANPPRLVSATPVSLFLREHAEVWQRLREDSTAAEGRTLDLPDNAQRVLEVLTARGASFFNDIVHVSGLGADAVRRAVGALVAAGLATSDGFSGLRALIAASRSIPPVRDRRAHFAGRWSALRRTDQPDRDRDLETFARVLLRRYGVVFRRVLLREPCLVPWRDLTRVYRRLEARGEIRGGRFVTGMSGEQFALPEAVERLREVRRLKADGVLRTISAADPLNLTGIITAGDRVRVAARSRIVYRDGVPLCVREGDVVRELTTIDSFVAEEAARALKTSVRTVTAAIR
jgi:ATP-dependent Lhr-like helicase